MACRLADSLGVESAGNTHLCEVVIEFSAALCAGVHGKLKKRAALAFHQVPKEPCTFFLRLGQHELVPLVRCPSLPGREANPLRAYPMAVLPAVIASPVSPCVSTQHTDWGQQLSTTMPLTQDVRVRSTKLRSAYPGRSSSLTRGPASREVDGTACAS